MPGALGSAVVGAQPQCPPLWPQEDGWLLGPSGRAAGKGRSCEWEELEEMLIYPVERPRGRAGQGRVQADTPGWLPSGGLQTPTPPPISWAPSLQPKEDASLKQGPREESTTGAWGFPSTWLSSSPTCFLGWLLRTSPGPPWSSEGGIPPPQVKTKHPARIPMVLEAWEW